MNTKSSQPLLAALVISAFATSLPFQVALADELDTFNIHLTESFSRDDNLFRLPDGVDPATLGTGHSSRSDNIRVDTIGLTFDKQYSLQRFHLGARYSQSHYSTYDYLNYDATNIDGRWNWSLTPHITGLLSAERNEVLNNFADYRNYSKSVRTTDRFKAHAEFGSIGAIRFLVGAGQTDVTDSKKYQEDWDTRTRSAQAGLRYLSGANNTIGYWYRQNQVDWLDRTLDPVNLYDDQAKQVDHEIFGKMELGGQSSLEGAIVRVDRSHEHFGQRDFRGTAGHLDFIWATDSGVSITAFARRNYASWLSQAASYYVADSYGFTPVWKISQKIIFQAKFEHTDQKFEGALVSVGDVRHDKLDSAQIGLSWEPWRNLVIGINAQQSRRRSNEPDLDFDDTTVGGSLGYTF